MDLPEFIYESAEYLRAEGISDNIEAAIILGSGLGNFAEQIKQSILIPYSQIPHFCSSSTEGHAGEMVFGTIRGESVIAFSGRFHYYEGFSFEQTAIPVYLSKALSVNKLIISNAAGAINTSYSIGDLMIIESVIRGGKLFFPIGYQKSQYLHHQWIDDIHRWATQLGIATQTGTYLYVTGPNYETKAEIRAFRIIGADAVGMSTAPELFEAARLKLKTVAISMISNMAAGITNKKLSHDEITTVVDFRKEDFAKLVKKLIEEF